MQHHKDGYQLVQEYRRRGASPLRSGIVDWAPAGGASRRGFRRLRWMLAPALAFAVAGVIFWALYR